MKFFHESQRELREITTNKEPDSLSYVEMKEIREKESVNENIIENSRN